MNWGLHFGNRHPFVNDFLVGGNDFVIRNQILFPGFRLNGISTSSAFMGQIGMRINFSSKFSLGAGPSFLWYDIIGSNIRSEERRVGKECRYRVVADQEKQQIAVDVIG